MSAVRHERRDRGSADVLGLVLVAPIAIALALLVVFLGRQVDARAQVQAAAEAGAQAAARERTRESAAVAAQRVVGAALADNDGCEHPSTAIDLADFRAGGTVTVTVACTVTPRRLEHVAAPAALSARATAVIDRFRATEGGT